MKYRIVKSFTDKYDKTIKYEKDKVYEFTEERANEILSVGNLIEKIEEVVEPAEKVVEETKKKKSKRK